MDMGMRNLETQHAYTHPLARNGRLNRQRNLLCKSAEARVCSVIEIEDIVILHISRNHESMPLHERIDVEECVEILILRNLV